MDIAKLEAEAARLDVAYSNGVSNECNTWLETDQHELIRNLLAALRQSPWLPISDEAKEYQCVIYRLGDVVVPAWYCALPGENCWYEYGSGPADDKEEFMLSEPTHYMPFPEPPGE